MCQKRSSVKGLVLLNHESKWIRLDPCIRHLVSSLSWHGYHTVGSCCGHKKYPMTIVCKTKTNRFYELISGKDIPRTKRFYKKDKEGFYYIPEVSTEVML